MAHTLFSGFVLALEFDTLALEKRLHLCLCTFLPTCILACSPNALKQSPSLDTFYNITYSCIGPFLKRVLILETGSMH